MRVKIEGLREFRAAVDNTQSGTKKEVRLVLNEAANVVVTDSKPVVAANTGAASKSIRAASTQSKSRVRAGGAKAPYYPWLDFGGKVGKYRQVDRSYNQDGRYIYPTYRQKRDSGEFQETMLEAMEALATKHGLDVSR